MMESIDWPVIVTGAILAIKGFAAYVANNTNTQSWGKFGKVIEFIGSVDKKAKLTGDVYADSVIKSVADAVPKKTIVGNLLRALS